MCNLVRVVAVNETIKCHLDMGIYGMDTPRKLTREVFSNMQEMHPDTEIIVVNGDFSRHGVALKTKHGMPTKKQMA